MPRQSLGLRPPRGASTRSPPAPRATPIQIMICGVVTDWTQSKKRHCGRRAVTTRLRMRRCGRCVVTSSRPCFPSSTPALMSAVASAREPARGLPSVGPQVANSPCKCSGVGMAGTSWVAPATGEVTFRRRILPLGPLGGQCRRQHEQQQQQAEANGKAEPLGPTDVHTHRCALSEAWPLHSSCSRRRRCVPPNDYLVL